MCAGCPGGRAVSPATAHLNLHGGKRAVLAALRREVGPRATITLFGDRWLLRSRTGAQQVLPDLEHLVAELAERGLLDRSAVPEDAAGADLVAALVTAPGP
ncbi:hypothetical protein GMA12_10095 [Kocuria sediminis]|uniref:Uncharacterized protein n=1 Tax=Kocuria sediminis TaxID=1038857 RepID=A0A6N8GKP9_9MICC|nr:hypothetical protein [Kocuria sediminis]MUN63488.1 hypothetical protein [Kocuria sediminis]